MYCQTSTDSPNDAPNDSATVPTMTSAAIKLRVMISMIDENEAKRTDSRDHQVVFSAVAQIFISRRGACDVDLGVRERCSLERLLGRRLYLVDTRNCLRVSQDRLAGKL